MRIAFRAHTNKDVCMINTATFRLKDGGMLTVDRDETEWTVENGKLDMVWRNCYLWEINGVNIFDVPFYPGEEIITLMEGATFVTFDLEEDSDDDYMVTDVVAVIS